MEGAAIHIEREPCPASASHGPDREGRGEALVVEVWAGCRAPKEPIGVPTLSKRAEGDTLDGVMRVVRRLRGVGDPMHVRNSDDGSIEIPGFPSRETAPADDGRSQKLADHAPGPEKSDNLMVPGKRPNKRRPDAEAAEGRGGDPHRARSMSRPGRSRARPRGSRGGVGSGSAGQASGTERTNWSADAVEKSGRPSTYKECHILVADTVNYLPVLQTLY
jgi:hypothetical protein